MMGSFTVCKDSLASVKSVVGDKAIPPAGSALQTCKWTSMTGAIDQAITPATALLRAGINSWLNSSMLRSQLALSSQS